MSGSGELRLEGLCIKASPLDFIGNSGKRSLCNRATSDAFIFRLL